MSAAWARHAMCESALRLCRWQDWCQLNNGGLFVCADASKAISKVHTFILLLVEKKLGREALTYFQVSQ